MTHYRFEDYHIDVEAGRVDRHGARVPLQPRPFALLVHLIEERQRVVPTDELLRRFWRGAPDSRAALARAVLKLRRALPRRATGARTVVHARVVRGDGGELSLVYEAQGTAPLRGSVACARPTELAARFADALVQALAPSAPARPPSVAHDPLADEAFARGLQALTAHPVRDGLQAPPAPGSDTALPTRR